MGVKYFQIAWSLKKLLTSSPLPLLQAIWLFLQGVTSLTLLYLPAHLLSPYEMIHDGKPPPLLILLTENFSGDEQKTENKENRNQTKQGDDRLKRKQKQSEDKVLLSCW